MVSLLIVRLKKKKIWSIYNSPFPYVFSLPPFCVSCGHLWSAPTWQYCGGRFWCARSQPLQSESCTFFQNFPDAPRKTPPPLQRLQHHPGPPHCTSGSLMDQEHLLYICSLHFTACKENKTDMQAGSNILIIVLFKVALVKDIVSQETLLLIQLWVIPVVPQVFLSQHKAASSLHKFNRSIWVCFPTLSNSPCPSPPLDPRALPGLSATPHSLPHLCPATDRYGGVNLHCNTFVGLCFKPGHDC